MSYSELEYEIFSRQFILKNFNEDNILKLNNAKIIRTHDVRETSVAINIVENIIGKEL